MPWVLCVPESHPHMLAVRIALRVLMSLLQLGCVLQRRRMFKGTPPLSSFRLLVCPGAVIWGSGALCSRAAAVWCLVGRLRHCYRQPAVRLANCRFQNTVTSHRQDWRKLTISLCIWRLSVCAQLQMMRLAFDV